MELKVQPEWLEQQAKKIGVDMWSTKDGWYITVLQYNGNSIESALRPTVVASHKITFKDMSEVATNAHALDVLAGSLMDLGGGTYTTPKQQ